MRRETTIIQPQLLLEEYRRLLQEDTAVRELPLVVTGNSMSPFLIHGRDTVFLSRLERPARRGDILLYRRDTGGYVLHRVCHLDAQGLTMLGDAQTVKESGIREDQVIAVVTRVERKGKPIAPGSFWWMFFEKVWIRLVPLRKPVHRLLAEWTRWRKNVSDSFQK